MERDRRRGLVAVVDAILAMGARIDPGLGLLILAAADAAVVLLGAWVAVSIAEWAG